MSSERKALAQPVIQSLREFTLGEIGGDEGHEMTGKFGLFVCGTPLGGSKGFGLESFAEQSDLQSKAPSIEGACVSISKVKPGTTRFAIRLDSL